MLCRLQSNQKILNPDYEGENTATSSEPVLRNVVEATFDDMKQMVFIRYLYVFSVFLDV